MRSTVRKGEMGHEGDALQDVVASDVEAEVPEGRGGAGNRRVEGYGDALRQGF
jgi:hypothetical protein